MARMNTKTKKHGDVRPYLLVCLRQLGPQLRAVSDAVDSPNPSSAVAHLLAARASITEAINAAQSQEAA